MSIIQFTDSSARSQRSTVFGAGPRVPANAFKLNLTVDYTGSADSRIRTRGLSAHVWTDGGCLHQLGEGYDDAESLWQSLDLEQSSSGSVEFDHTDFGHVYVAVFDNRAADDKGGSGAVAVQGERRAFAVFDAAQIRNGGTIEADLLVPEAGDKTLGTVRVWTHNESRKVRAVHSNAYKAAFVLGEALAVHSRAIEGVAGITEGMHRLDTTHWNNRRTSLPGSMFVIGMARAPENPLFIELIVRAAAEKRGIQNVEELARAAIRSVQEGGERPTQQTLDFAMLVAEAYHIAVTTARYLTDLYDKNRKGRPWRSANLEPVELMTANIREDRADDCEGFAAGLGSLMYGTANGKDCGNLLYDATRCIVRCWLPFVTLGQASRHGEDPQYDTGDNMNAHSWLMLIPTSAVRAAMDGCPHAHLKATLDFAIMLDPWTYGLPVLVVDGTTSSELTARSWLCRGKTTCTLGKAAAGCSFVSVVRELDPNFHRILRNGYTPYGVVSAADPQKRVFEIYWYVGHEKSTRYGAPVWDVHRLPQTPHSGFSNNLPPKSEYTEGYWRGSSPPSVWIAACTPMSIEDLRTLRPAIASMHPVRNAPADPSSTGGKIGEEMLRRVVETLRSSGVKVVTSRKRKDDARFGLGRSRDAWAETPRVLAIKYSDAMDLENIRLLASGLGGRMVKVYVKAFWRDEPQIWMENGENSF